MHKRLYKLLAVMLLPVFLIACEKHEAANEVDKDLLAATLQKAMDTAAELDNMNMKAFGMAEVGAGMATVEPAKAGQVLNEAMVLASQTRGQNYRMALAELKATTADWPAEAKDQVADAIDRIEKGTTRVWVIRKIAEGIMINDPDSAGSILASAANAATMIPDQKYRDLDLRSISALMAEIDVEAATAIASRISDPRVEAWALTEIGTTATESNTGNPGLILDSAAEVARSITRKLQPSSSLLVPEASDEAKEMVLGAEMAKITASAARALAKVAVAMSSVDHGKARMMADEAVDIAAGIDDAKFGYTRSYALSDVAMEVAMFNTPKALDIAENIDAKHADARAAAMLAVIIARTGSVNATNMLSDIDSAVNIAEGIEDDYDRAKAMAALAKAAIPYSKEKAVDIAAVIEEDLGHHTYAFSLIKNEVLADVAVAWAGEDNEMAKKIVDPSPEDVEKGHGRYIVEPRFSKDAVLRTKAAAYMGIADKLMSSDEKAAMKFYTKAAGTAGDCKSTALQWRVAERLCMVDSDKLFEYAATISAGDFENQANSLAKIAADWSEKGNPAAGMVWDMAAKAANMVGDNLEGSALLNSVAAKCAGYDKDKATEIYAMSMQRLVKIGAEEG